MKYRGVDFPHPLLQKGEDDYIDCSFDIEVNESETTNDFVLAVNYLLECDGLKRLIDAGTAKVILSVNSGLLSYRQNFDFEKGVASAAFCVPKNNVAKKIEITSYVIASDTIESFSLDEHNAEYYNGISFKIRKGDILAKSSQIDIDVDDSELERPLSSVFNISEDSEMEMMIYPDFYDDKINIKLKPEAYDIYSRLRGDGNARYRRTLAGLIVLPVLTEAISTIIGNYQCDEESRDEMMLNRRWFRAIEKKLKEYNIDLNESDEPAVSIASKLLGDVVFGALSVLNDVIYDETSGNEFIGGDD